MTSPQFEEIIYEIADNVATITLNRPHRLNALTPTMRQELYDAMALAEGDREVRVIVITGAGRGFCSGGDVVAMSEAYDRKSEAYEKKTVNPLEDKMAPLRDKILLAMQNATKPVIGAINGPAAGGGLGLALGCDIRIASANARMGMTFAKRGLHPDWGGTYFLPRIVGTAKASELIWSGRMIDASEALALGIVSYVTDHDALMPRVYEMAQEFAQGPPVAIRMSKRAMQQGTQLREALEYEAFAQNICSGTKDAREGITAFTEKRDPVFTGE